MVKLYTAIGKYEIKKDSTGIRIPIIISNLKEFALSKEEMILWSIMVWNILKKDEAEKIFYEKAKKAGISPDCFDIVLNRLEYRGILISSEADKGDEALYNLLANLYIIPIRSSLIAKIWVFLNLFFTEHIPFSAVKTIFYREKYTEMERKILKLSSQTLLSCAEILKCIENEVTDISANEKNMKAIYGNYDSSELFIWFYGNHRKILEAISTLYLNRNIIFDRLA